MASSGKSNWYHIHRILARRSQVDEDSNETGKKPWADFKNAVWHEAFFRLLESIRVISRTGHWHKFEDGDELWLWPFIIILSADYEEQ